MFFSQPNLRIFLYSFSLLLIDLNLLIVSCLLWTKTIAGFPPPPLFSVLMVFQLPPSFLVSQVFEFDLGKLFFYLLLILSRALRQILARCLSLFFLFFHVISVLFNTPPPSSPTRFCTLNLLNFFPPPFVVYLAFLASLSDRRSSFKRLSFPFLTFLSPYLFVRLSSPLAAAPGA